MRISSQTVLAIVAGLAIYHLFAPEVEHLHGLVDSMVLADFVFRERVGSNKISQSEVDWVIRPVGQPAVAAKPEKTDRMSPHGSRPRRLSPVPSACAEGESAVAQPPGRS
jgi:hypothetical protein